MERVLITGGAGFIGSHTVEEFLNNENYEIIVVDNLISGKYENIKDFEIEFHRFDIRDKIQLESLFEEKKIDYIIHNAAQISVKDSMDNPVYDAEQNILGLINLMDLSVKYGVKKILFSSSAAVYGNSKDIPLKEGDSTWPQSFYGLSKLTGENYIKLYSQLYGLKYIIFRYANVYGERQSRHGEAGVISIFSHNMQKGESIVIEGNGEQTRDFIYVKDIAKANYMALKNNVEDEIINVSTNSEICINDLFKYMAEKLSYSGEALYEKERDGDIKRSILDNGKLKSLLKIEPEYSLKSGIDIYLQRHRDIDY